MASSNFPRTLMLLGSGELGKEVAIAAQRLGCRVIAVDRYAGAPAMQVADVAEVVPMTDPEALKAVVLNPELTSSLKYALKWAIKFLEKESFILTSKVSIVTLQ